MSAKQQKVVIKIPKQFDPSERKAIANEIVQFIVKRTRDLGLDKNDKPFKKYSKQYAINKGVSQTDVDLTLSSEMLDELKYLSDKSGSITIDPGIFGDDFNVQMLFDQPEPMQDRKTMVETQKLEMDAGFTTRKIAITKLNPDMTPEQIDELVLEIENTSVTVEGQ